MENAPRAANDEEDFGSGQEITGWDADNTSDTVLRNTEQQPITLSNPDIAAGDGEKDAEIEESFEMRKLTDYIEKLGNHDFMAVAHGSPSIHGERYVVERHEDYAVNGAMNKMLSDITSAEEIVQEKAMLQTESTKPLGPGGTLEDPNKPGLRISPNLKCIAVPELLRNSIVGGNDVGNSQVSSAQPFDDEDLQPSTESVQNTPTEGVSQPISLQPSSVLSSSPSVRHSCHPTSRDGRTASSQHVSKARSSSDTFTCEERRPVCSQAPFKYGHDDQTNGYGSKSASVVTWERLDSTQKTMRQNLEEFRELVTALSKKVKEVEAESTRRAELQAAKDTAQDEILSMELKQLVRHLATKLSRTELMDLATAQNQKLRNLEVAFRDLLEEKADFLHQKLHHELENVLRQLNTIQQAGENVRNIVEKRVKQCIKDQEGFHEKLETERKEKEEVKMQYQIICKRMRQEESRQKNLEVRQESKIQELEKQCDQWFAAEAVNRHKDMMGMATALRQDLIMNLQAVRKESKSMGVELMTRLDSKMLQCQQSTSQIIAEWNAAYTQNLVALETTLRRDLTLQIENTQKEALIRHEALADSQKAAESRALTQYTGQEARMDQVQAKLTTAITKNTQAMQDDLESKTAATQREFRDQHMQLSQRLSVAIQRLALYEVKSGERYDLLKNTLLELALKLVRKKVVAGLGPDPSIPDLLTQLDVQRTESTDQLLRLEQDIEGLSGSYEQLHGSVQALVTRSNHWAALDVRLQEYHESLVKHCRHIFARSSLSSYGPDQVLQLQGRGLLLKKETVDLIASHSYRIAKTIALKADYDIIRHNVESKDTLTDNQCDAKILQSRETYLMRFLEGVKRAVEVGLDGEGRASGITEIITQFHSKLEQAIRLALSKFSRIHTGRSLFGKISLEAEAACLACNRQFPEEPGQGDRRASFRKSVTGSNSIKAISGSNGISQRGSIYRQNRNSFKTFSSSKEASFLENAIKEQRGRRSDARENVVSTARASTPANRQGRRATSYSLGTATIIS